MLHDLAKAFDGKPKMEAALDTGIAATNAPVKTKSTNFRLRFTFWQTRIPSLPEGKSQSEIGRFGLDVRVGGSNARV